MIGWLKGTLISKRPPALLIEVHGIGYELEAPMTTFYTLPQVGEPTALFVHHLVRDDAQNLYGFAKEHERNVFRMLLKVNGVGAKLALTILSGMDAASLSQCVFEGDTAALSKLPGIGKKTAERLVIEMRDRLTPTPVGVTNTTGGGESTPSAAEDPVREAIGALVSLGFKPQEASRQVHSVHETGLGSEEIVRRALKTMVQ